MRGPLSYSQPWKSSLCSCDANCLQPDTFLDLAERAELRVKLLEAPPIPASAGSQCTRGPILWALSLLCPGYLSVAVCGRESCGFWDVGRKQCPRATALGGLQAPLKRRLQMGALRKPRSVLGDKQGNALLSFEAARSPAVYSNNPAPPPHLQGPPAGRPSAGHSS